MSILRGHDHSHVSEREGNLAKPSQKRGAKSLANLPLGSSEVAFLHAVALGKPREKVVVETLMPDGDVKYWRDSGGVHHVPKRGLDVIILGSL